MQDAEHLERVHKQLMRQIEALQREHDELERRPFDRAAHEAHRRKLAQKKVELAAHLEELKKQRLG
jgi:hypothetical protein